jgi:hypothetical protein
MISKLWSLTGEFLAGLGEVSDLESASIFVAAAGMHTHDCWAGFTEEDPRMPTTLFCGLLWFGEN